MPQNQMMPLEMPFGRDQTINPVLGPLGIRIVLDLSEFAGLRPERRLRCVYLPLEKFTSVKDVKKHVRKGILKTEAKIQLFLGGKFWIPNAESIRVLQNDDVVVVRQKVGNPSRSQSSEDSRKMQCPPTFSNAAKKIKNGTNDESSSGESDSEAEPVLKQKNVKGVVPSKANNSSSSSSESSDSDCKQVKQERKVVLSTKPSSSTRSTVKNHNQLAKEPAKTSSVPSINPQKAAKKRAASSASSESETDSQQQETSSGALNQESNLTSELTKRKRKRQRKSKNKNKISNPECESLVENQLLGKLNGNKNEVVAPSRIPVPAARTYGNNKKIYFEENEDEDAVSPTTQTMEQESPLPSRPTVVVASRSFDPGSSHISCEEAMLVGGAQKNGHSKTTNKPRATSSSVQSPIVIASRRCVDPASSSRATAIPEESDINYKLASSFPVLKEPPQHKMHIAFKILTMSSDYTPGVSDYIFGVVVSTDGFNLHLLITHDENPVEAKSGKFECEEETEDDLNKKGKILEYKWQDMIDPRLVVPFKENLLI